MAVGSGLTEKPVLPRKPAPPERDEPIAFKLTPDYRRYDREADPRSFREKY